MYVLYACTKRSLRSPHAEHTSEHVKSFSTGLQSVVALVMESVLSVREGNKSGKTESEGVSQSESRGGNLPKQPSEVPTKHWATQNWADSQPPP